MEKSMKIIIIIALSFLSINAYSYKIISEKITHSAGSTAWIVRHPHSSIMPKSYQPSHVTAYAVTKDMEGKINQYLLLTGEHWVSLQNFTDSPQRYKYVYFIGAGNAKGTYEYEIILKPHENFREDGTSFVTFQSEYLGTFQSTASTTISGAESYEFKNTGQIWIKN
jgi:hypothetical protein